MRAANILDWLIEGEPRREPTPGQLDDIRITGTNNGPPYWMAIDLSLSGVKNAALEVVRAKKFRFKIYGRSSMRPGVAIGSCDTLLDVKKVVYEYYKQFGDKDTRWPQFTVNLIPETNGTSCEILA